MHIGGACAFFISNISYLGASVVARMKQKTVGMLNRITLHACLHRGSSLSPLFHPYHRTHFAMAFRGISMPLATCRHSSAHVFQAAYHSPRAYNLSPLTSSSRLRKTSLMRTAHHSVLGTHYSRSLSSNSAAMAESQNDSSG